MIEDEEMIECEIRINRELMIRILSCKRNWDLKKISIISFFKKMNVKFEKILNYEYIIDIMNDMIQVIYDLKRKKWEIEFEWDLYF